MLNKSSFVYERLIEHYLGDNGKKIIAIETD